MLFRSKKAIPHVTAWWLKPVHMRIVVFATIASEHRISIKIYFERKGLMINTDKVIAYFSMEIGLDVAMPTYSGGLGILAGDTIRSAADMEIPMVAVSLLYRKGYFYQRLNDEGWQTEEPVDWVIEDFLELLPVRQIVIEDRLINIAAWQYEVKGSSGYVVPVIFLDTDIEENAPEDRELAGILYGGDQYYRLCQEIILGIGGVRVLRSLGFSNLQRFHMNEGHSSLLTLELLDEYRKNHNIETITPEAIDAVRQQCIFTTHTPVSAGHDQFPMELVDRVLGQHEAFTIKNVFCCNNTLNMTYLALNLSHYINGVAKKHGEISRHMFAQYHIDSITNGVHAETWTCPAFQELYDHFIPGWREDNFSLRYALSISQEEIWKTHYRAKRHLIDHINRTENLGMDYEVFTMGFARRATTYKRPELIFQDIEKLKSINNKYPIQLIYAGKAHPNDQQGKEMIAHIVSVSRQLDEIIKIAYLPNYDMELGKMITSGVDVWLNTPMPPWEASGTSGMKAALNGVPSLSILDGWWIEGCIEGVTGWAIESEQIPLEDHSNDALMLYCKLEDIVLPTYYKNRIGFLTMMSHTIALNGSFFNTQRMIQQYVMKGYFH